ncbi:unnamed protein product (macronuclear) [Paramecium tetraurelia]|uniref:Transmembrane protein n=1 Tax=Paramecium tetraurelia TaxID=5888 RepID=A0CV32_PARTE|nr:uncharacterized protein GSPATT00010817001 [Paramecium tetraurelia]CAK74649.1 unnamed protein product [Paramecium tetraurelia]|eukprot:XP_001442046.1 hypothetical protein (macronuclear) [Paramecium tetraurelia strain d4-2]
MYALSIYTILGIITIKYLSYILLSFDDKFQQNKLPFLIKSIGLYGQLFYTVFHMLFSTLSCLFIYQQYKQVEISNLNYIHILFGILCFVILQLEAIYHLQITEQSIDGKIICFDRLRVTVKEYIIQFLNLIIIILFSVVEKSQIVSWIIHLLVLLSSSLNAINLQQNQIVIENSKKFIIYFSDSFTMVYVGYSLIQLILQSQSFQVIIYTIFSFPLLLQILIKVDQHLNYIIFHQAFERTKIQLFAITQLLIKKQNNSKFPAILKLFIYNHHKKKCNDIQCYCHHNKLLIDPKDTATITSEIDKGFIQKKLKQIRKFIMNYKFDNLDDLQYYTVLYGALLSNNGWPIQSIRHFNQLIYGRKNWRSSQQSINQSILKPNSFSVTQKNDSSSQTINEPEKKFQEIQMNDQKRFQKNTLTQMVKFDFIQIQKIQFFLTETKYQLKNLFGGHQLTAEQHSLSEQIQAFMKQELKMDQHVNEIKKILKLKIKYFENLNQQIKEKKISQIMKGLSLITNKLMIFKNVLKLEYDNYQSKRLLSLQIFYEAEIFRNILGAFKLYNQASLSEDSIAILNQNMNVKFYSNKISYIILEIDDDLQGAEIIKYSTNLRQMIECSPNDEINFYSLFLPFISREHPLLISKFFKIGQSKFYKQFNQSFIKTKKDLAKSIIFSFDNVVQLEQEKITIIGLLQEIDIQNPFIMVDVNQVVGGITKSLLSNLGYNQVFIDNITSFLVFYQIKITQIFSDFNEFVQNENQQSVLKFSNIDTCFIDLEYFFNELQNENFDSIHQEAQFLLKLWDDQHVKSYYSSITIYVYEIYGYNYYVIQIDSLVQTQKFTKTQDKSSESIKNHEQSQSFEISQLNLSIEEAMPRLINQFTIRNRETYSQNMQKNSQIINLFAVKEVDQEEVYLKMDQLQIMLSPNKSTSQLIEKQQNKLLRLSSQQDYYTINTYQKLNKHQNSMDHDGFNLRADQKQIENLLKNSLQLTDVGGNSEIIKKYELLDSLTKLKIPKILKIALATFILFVLIQTICLFLVVSILHNDIQQFISDIEIIALHASIQGPHDLFFSMRNTITSYQQMAREGFIPTSKVTNLTEPYYLNIQFGYYELRDSFYHQLDNDYLKMFLDEEEMTLLFMRNNDTENYAMEPKTFRECLLIILQYQFAQMRTFQKRQSTAGQPYQVFLFSNYYNIQDKLEGITNDILQYSKNRSRNVGIKWQIICLFFALIIIINSIFLMSEFHQYYKLYDRFLQLLNFVDKQKVQLEIDKLNQLQKLITANQEFIYSYQFDLQRQEQMMNNYVALNKIQNAKKIVENDASIKFARRNILVFLTFVACIFSVYIIVIQIKTNEYISKYDDTADFYFMIQNLKFRSGSMYMYREHLLRWKNFTYLTAYDLDRAYLLIDKAQTNIQQYLVFTSSFQADKYLLSDQFISFFEYQQTHDLCEFVDQIYLNFMSLYCEKSFDGLLKTGQISVLNFMSSQIKSQQAVNNFTKRAEVNLYELEGSQIVIRSFFRISDEFQVGLKQITTEQNEFTLIITVIFFCYLIIFLLVVVFILKNLLVKEYAMLRRIVYLVPQQIVLGDESFQRFLKQLALNQELK